MFTFSKHYFLLFAWRLNQVTKNVRKQQLWPFRWVVCPVTDTVWTVQPNTAQFFYISCSVERQKLFYLGHSESTTPCFSNEGQRIAPPHAESTPTAMTWHRPSLSTSNLHDPSLNLWHIDFLNFWRLIS